MSNASGKLVILAIVAVSLAAAGTSWWFRYNATHRAARFWGPATSQLIRSSAEVKLYKEPTAPTDSLGVDLEDTAAVQAAIEARIAKSAIDISNAPGLLHLRSALLEDSSFIWPPTNDSHSADMSEIAYWWLTFTDTKNAQSTTIWFSRDCRQALRFSPIQGEPATAISTDPISAGLREVFAEFAQSKTSPEALRPPSPR